MSSRSSSRSRVIIAGSRDFNDYDYLRAYLATIPPWLHITEVVSGRAAGADSLGERWAEERNIPVKLFPADWKRHGKKAGPMRNAEMGVYADGLIAFWDGESRGTQHMISFMQHYNKWTYVVRTDIPWCRKTENGRPVLNNVKYTQESPPGKFENLLESGEKI
jgi:hypothetical protein